MIDSTVSGNVSGGAGGGISSDGSLYLINSTVSGNQTIGSTFNGFSAGGGGIYVGAGIVVITDSTISGNSTSGFDAGGGGIYIRNGGFGGGEYYGVLVTNSTISGNNTAGFASRGGGILIRTGSLRLIDSTVSGNSTSGRAADGGGINGAFSGVTLTNSTISGNSTSGDETEGGGIWSSNRVSVLSSTIANNSAAGVGGGISQDVDDFSNRERVTVVNSIVAGNTDNGTAPNIRALELVDNLMVEHSLIGDTTGSNITGSTGNRNILDQPTMLGPLADNGGPTLTHALLSGSPAVDAGSDTLAIDTDGNLLTTDQRGTEFDRSKFGRADIGAFESGFDAPPIAPYVLSANIDEGGVLARPDLWNELSVVFDADVTVAATDLSLFNDSLGGVEIVLSGVGFNYDSSTNTATWDFTTLANPLAAAFYTYQLNGSSIFSEGLALDGNVDGTGGDNFVDQHYVALPGDLNLDGKVDVPGDVLGLIENLGTTIVGNWADGDFNGDRNVDVARDVLTLISRLGESVVPPTTSSASAQVSVEPATPATDEFASAIASPVLVSSTFDTPAFTATADLPQPATVAIFPTVSQPQLAMVAEGHTTAMAVPCEVDSTFVSPALLSPTIETPVFAVPTFAATANPFQPAPVAIVPGVSPAQFVLDAEEETESQYERRSPELPVNTQQLSLASSKAIDAAFASEGLLDDGLLG